MQSFLPYPDFVRSARVLDDKRLGKQRVECKQILCALTNPQYGWQHHPAVKMWRGYEGALALYAVDICRTWRERGFRDSLLPEFQARLLTTTHCDVPPWLSDPAFCASHRSNLLRKDPSHYSQFGWLEPDNLPYVWPVS